MPNDSIFKSTATEYLSYDSDETNTKLYCYELDLMEKTTITQFFYSS